MTELVEQYGISRTTGYKWVDRYEVEGVGGLLDKSRRPLTNPQATDAALLETLLRCGNAIRAGARRNCSRLRGDRTSTPPGPSLDGVHAAEGPRVDRPAATASTARPSVGDRRRARHRGE
jgi:hypothetical protein